MPNLRLKEVRDSNKLTQKEFGEYLNLKQEKIRDIENFKAKVTPEIAILVEDKFNINLRWLLTGRGNMFIDENSKTSNVNVNNSSNVAVNNGNGTITINAKDYVDSSEVKELLELLKDVPKSWIHNIIEKLKKSLNAIDDFK